jgi:hypothetical protein
MFKNKKYIFITSFTFTFTFAFKIKNQMVNFINMTGANLMTNYKLSIYLLIFITRCIIKISICHNMYIYYT